MRVTNLLAVLAMGLALAWPGCAQADDTICADCHEGVASRMTDQIHMRNQPIEGSGRQTGCESCHGDGTGHMVGGDPDLIRTFAESSAADSEACLSCHGGMGETLSEWHASTHSTVGVTCFECHSIHDSHSQPLDSCETCHQEVYAQLELPSHHPVREGMVNCADCHDSHRTTASMVPTDMRTSDLCYTCHQDKEGSMIVEHAQVVQDCLLCHTPHGSVADNLLIANGPMLCLQCHEFHSHAGLTSPDRPVDSGG